MTKIEKKVLSADVFAVSPAGDRRQVILEGSYDPLEKAIQIEDREPPEMAIGHFNVVLLPSGDSLRLGPKRSLMALSELLHKMLPAEIRAVYTPQYWQNDNAVSLPHGVVVFDALPRLLKLSRDQVVRMFSRGGDLDELSFGLRSAALHQGPFDVSVEQDDVVEMAAFYAGCYDDFGSRLVAVEDFSDEEWARFVSVASAVVAAREAIIEEAEGSKVLELSFGKFTFDGGLGRACALSCEWKTPAEDPQEKLACSVIEASLLASFASGALHDGVSFNQRLVKAFETTWDALAPILEAAEEGGDMPAARPRGVV